MDPLTQGIVGAIAVQSVARRDEQRLGAALGFVAGTLADLDVLIRSAEDPLLFLEFHRHFTHSLAFVPVAATLLALLAWPLLRTRGDGRSPPLRPGRLWLLLAVAYGTHGLLDACTTYGTSLLWPFSEARVSWNLVGVVDPGLTLPALVLAALAWRRRSRRAGRVALAWVFVWLGLGLVQRERAEDLLLRTTAGAIDRAEVKPTLLNLVLWRGLWEADGAVHAIALRPGILGPDRISDAASAPAFRRERDLPALRPDSVAARDIERFRRFSDAWLVVADRDGERLVIGDARYAMLPDRIRPLWGIRVDPSAPERHAEYLTLREGAREKIRLFLSMIRGRGLRGPESERRMPGSKGPGPRADGSESGDTRTWSPTAP